MKIIPFLFMPGLAALWALVVGWCMRSIKNLRAMVAQVKDGVRADFPASEIHPLLCPGREENGERIWFRTDEKGKRDLGPLSKLPDVEEEKACAYYNRTGQIICNAKNRTLEEISTGRWYGYAEWMQDMISGRVQKRA